MLQIDIKHDLDKLARQLKADRKAIPKAAGQAINKAAGVAKTAAKRAVARESGFTQKEVLANTDLKKANPATLTAVLSMTGAPRNLIRFKAKRTKAGVSAMAYGVKKTYRGTFIANQGRTVFKRASRRRLPIKAVYGPGIAQTFAREKVQAEVVKVFQEKFPAEFERALNRAMKRP